MTFFGLFYNEFLEMFDIPFHERIDLEGTSEEHCSERVPVGIVKCWLFIQAIFQHYDWIKVRSE